MIGTANWQMWKKSRFYFALPAQHTLGGWLCAGYVGNRIPWSEVMGTADKAQKVLREGLEEVGEHVLVFAISRTFTWMEPVFTLPICTGAQTTLKKHCVAGRC